MDQHRAPNQQVANGLPTEPSQGQISTDNVSTEQSEETPIAVEYYIDDSNPLLEYFSNHFAVTDDGTIFHLTFAQAAPPVINGLQDIEQIRKTPRRPAPIVARVAVPAAMMQLFLDLAVAKWNAFVLSQQQGDYRTIERENQVSGEGDNR